MATVAAHRALALKPETIIATVKFTGKSDVEANGFTINQNPENIVSTVTRSDEGDIAITLAQKWAALDNCLVSTNLESVGAVLASETVSTTKVVNITTFNTTTGSPEDADDGVIRATLILRLQA